LTYFPFSLDTQNLIMVTLKNLFTASVVLSAIAAIASAVGNTGPQQPNRLRMEYMNNPSGVDVKYQPRLTWALAHTDRGEVQTAYRINVFKYTGSGWQESHDTGLVKSNISQNVHLTAPLENGTAYQWTVMFVDSQGKTSPWSEYASFSTGIDLAASGAKWIGINQSGCFQARQEFYTKKEVARATAYGVGLGYYKLYVDGEKVSTHELGSFTTYATRVYYDTYEITAAMRTTGSSNHHVIAVSVGDGWYAQDSVHAGQNSLIMRVEILYTDGTTDYVETNATWKVSHSPVTKVDIYKGENYDATLETPGWTTAAYSEVPSVWSSPNVMAPPSPNVTLASHAVLPHIEIAESYTPCDFWESSPGVYVFDFCQNMAGFATLRVPEGMAITPGQNISYQHAEVIHGPKPAAIHNHYNNAPEINTYVTRGDGQAIEHTTMFTYAGFRYIALTGFPGTPDFNTLTAHFVHTAYELTGSVSFSDPLLTSVQHITRTAAMSNFQSIPTDCPQRERRGWLGDAQLSCETNMHNFDMGAPYTSFIQQIEDSQDPSGSVQDCVPWYGHGQDPADPAWGAAFALIADWVGKYYHDDQIFATHYGAIQKHLEQLISTSVLDNEMGLLAYGGWGDWCPPSGCRACWTRGNLQESRNSVIVSSFYYISELRIVARYAGILGKTSDQQRYTKLAEAAEIAFNKVFYDPVNKTYRENRTCGEYLSPQTTISLAAQLNLIPTEDYDAVIDTLVDDVASHGWHLNVGIVGIKYLLPALSAAGRGDAALMIAQARTPPSYIYMVEQGATTLWETWTGTQYQPVASRNHIMFGANSEWYFKHLAGLKMTEESRGWQQLALKPEVWNEQRGVSICANLSSTQSSIVTARGLLSGAWNCIDSNPDDCGVADEHSVLQIKCDNGGEISSVDFASFGTPNGTCSSGFQEFNCSAADSMKIVSDECLGKSACSVNVTSKHFKGDPCFLVKKQLAVKVTCTGTKGKTAVFEYSVNIPTGSTATVSLPQFGKSADISEAQGEIWKNGAYVSGVSGVTGASVIGTDIAISVGSGAYTFTVAV